MSRENADIVRRCYDLFSQGDPEGMLAYLDGEIEIIESAGMPGGGSLHGHEGFLRALEHWAGEFEDFRVEIERLIEAQDNVIALVRQWGRGRQSGAPVEIQVANVFRLRDGRVVQWRMFTALEEALAAVGRSE